MASGNNISYIRQHEINKTLWDRCMDQAPNRLVYGYSFYLDQMAGDWDGLVLNDYEAVMALPWRKKYGVHYLYQPFLTAQLGVFGSFLTAGLLRDFLDAIPAKFRLWEYSLNHANLFSLEGYALYQRTNYVLDMRAPYSVLYEGYRENTRRNIKKSNRYGCSLKTGGDLQAVLDLVKEQSPKITSADLGRFSMLCASLEKQVKVYTVLSDRSALLSAAIFLLFRDRAYYILAGSHPNGKTLGSSHALIDAFIRDHAERELLLDFEGSDIEKLAFFYSGFGSKLEKYAAIRRNKLPWWLRYLKK
jgi:hypothetical protein